MPLLRWMSLSLLLSSLPVAAQPEVIFGTGDKVLFREEETDRRFTRSKLFKALSEGHHHGACQDILRGLLMVFAEAAPMIHRRDETFYLDARLVHALNTQLSTPGFPGASYVALMVRRMMIDGELPPAWMETAKRLNPGNPIIDMGKMRFLADGLKPLDSFQLSVDKLKERYTAEVSQANSSARYTADLEFRDNYLDRLVGFGGLKLVDLGPVQLAKLVRGKPKLKKLPPESSAMVAILEHRAPPPPGGNYGYSINLPPPTASQQQTSMMFEMKPPPPVFITAVLSERQYIDLGKLPKGSRMLVRGRLYDVNKGVSTIQLRDALIFEDRDWSQGSLLMDPRVIQSCPFGYNEITGIAPRQPGGFAH